jgi:excisionase family DNA binding protein
LERDHADANSAAARRDRLLGVEEAAAKLGVTTDWLYRHHKELPFTLRHGRRVRFSELGIEQYIRKRRG